MKPVLALALKGEVVEVVRNVRMVRAEARLDDCVRAAHQRFRLRRTVGVLEEQSEFVDADRPPARSRGLPRVTMAIIRCKHFHTQSKIGSRRSPN
jgi:hypothetical protein